MAKRTSLYIALLGALFYLPWLGGVHLFDWDEINFAEITREMMLTEDYLRVYINFQPFWEKPPFFMWMQLLAMKAFGVGEYAARLPNAICGMITLIVLYKTGKKLYDHRFGLLWALAYFGSVLPFLYFKSGIIDPYFNLFIFLGMYYFILAYWKKDRLGLDLPRSYWHYLFWGGFFIGMGILTKGPVALVISCLVFFVYWVYQRFRFYINVPQFLFFLVAASFITLAWFGIETYKNGPWYIATFTKYQYELFSKPVAGHKGFPGYHFIVVLAGCFPASLFALRAMWKMPAESQSYQQDFKRWMLFLFWTVLILFTIVKSKIVHYSSMAYFPLTFLAALSIYHMLNERIKLGRGTKAGVWIIGSLYLLVTFALPILAQNIDLLKPLLKDPFARANLDAEVRWTGLEVIPGIFLLGVLIAASVLWRRQQLESGIRTLFIGTAVFVMLTLVFFVKRIEGYSQRAAIEFYESKSREDCYIITHGYKSYAHLFYARKRPVTDERSYDKEWLLNGAIDKPVYVVTKIQKADELKAYPQLQQLGSKNGFVFFGRKPVK